MVPKKYIGSDVFVLSQIKFKNIGVIKKHKKELVFFTASILIHIVLSFFYRFDANQLSELEKVKTVDLVLKASTNSTKSKPKSRFPGKKQIQLKDLMPERSYLTTDLEKKVYKKISDGEQTVKQIEDLSFFKEVWRRVERKLYYPALFVESLVQGSAKVKVRLDYKGALDSYSLNVETSDKHLKAFVRRIVVESLKGSLHKKFWQTEKKYTYLELDFNFLLYSNEFNKHGRGNKVLNGYLGFERKAFNIESDVVSKMIPDYIPVGGGSLINPGKLYGLISGAAAREKKELQKKLEWFEYENTRIYNGSSVDK